jgi:hypothetical protein
MSGSISATRDYVHESDKGGLIDPVQSAGFVSDPVLSPIKASSQSHSGLASASTEDPSAFDASTHHPNTHYHPEKKLKKKKRAKKLGVGADSHVTQLSGVNVGGRSFAEHEKEAHERAERRDAELAHRAHEEEEGEEEEGEEGEEEGDEEEDVPEDQAKASHASHHENRVTGTEQERGAQAPAQPKPKPSSSSTSSTDKTSGAPSGDKHDSTEAAPSMKERASGLLASAQEKASGMMETVKQAPVVSSLLNKVGLGGGNKAEEGTEANAQAKKEEEA